MTFDLGTENCLLKRVLIKIPTDVTSLVINWFENG